MKDIAMSTPGEFNPANAAQKVARNLKRIRARIDAAAAKASRDANSIRLVAVTKYASVEETAALVRLGETHLAEARIQEAEAKIKAIQTLFPDHDLHWHLIGHLQTNKAAKAVKLFRSIHSIDSDRVARELEKEVGKQAALNTSGGSKLQCLIEVNAAQEANKFGLPPKKEALIELLKGCSELKSIRIAGLMAMAPYSEHPEATSRSIFQTMRALRDEVNAAKIYPLELIELSMGMTQDFEIAIEEGATMVRIGSALFEA
jgi:pyridoxal phosphate enzyme (YggS family)